MREQGRLSMTSCPECNEQMTVVGNNNSDDDDDDGVDYNRFIMVCINCGYSQHL